MAKPITTVKKHTPTDEERKQQRLDQLTSELAASDQALRSAVGILQELHDMGVLEAAQSMLKAREDLSKIALHQVARKPVTNTINHLMNATAALADIDPESTKKILHSVANGVEEAKQSMEESKKAGFLDILALLKDPDVFRAIKFGLSFLKGMGRGLKE